MSVEVEHTNLDRTIIVGSIDVEVYVCVCVWEKGRERHMLVSTRERENIYSFFSDCNRLYTLS